MRQLVIIYLQLTFCLYAQLGFAHKDRDDDNTVVRKTNPAIVNIAPQVQKQLGLTTGVLISVEKVIETVAYGQALDLLPLFDQINQYQIALAHQVQAKNDQILAQKNRVRNQKLYKNQLIADKILQQQHNLWQTHQLTWHQRQQYTEWLYHKLVLQWGKGLVQAILDEQSPLFKQLTQGLSTLVAINIPPTTSQINIPPSIWISPTGNRRQVVKANFLAQAPQVDPLMQGLRYFFITESKQVKPHVMVTAWLDQAEQTSGVIIPEKAVVWHLGQRLIFVKTAANQFEQRSLLKIQHVNTGYFTQDFVKAGEEIVITGAQMLLSSRYSSQIPDEDDD